MCVFGWELDGTGARLPPTAPWRPEKLIGSIWLSESPSAHPPTLSFHPTLFLPLPPSLQPSPPVGAATPGTHMVTPVWLQAVNVECVLCVSVCMCDIPGSMEADRAARPPAATVVPREMRADRLASLCQGQQGPQGGWRGREGHRGRMEGGGRGQGDR